MPVGSTSTATTAPDRSLTIGTSAQAAAQAEGIAGGDATGAPTASHDATWTGPESGESWWCDSSAPSARALGSWLS